MKVSGKVWKEYLASWPDGQWYDDHDMTVNGIEDTGDEDPKDTDVVAITCGVVYESESDWEGKSLTSHFSKWKKSLTVDTLVITVPKDKLEEFKRIAETYGVKFVG